LARENFDLKRQVLEANLPFIKDKKISNVLIKEQEDDLIVHPPRPPTQQPKLPPKPQSASVRRYIRAEPPLLDAESQLDYFDEPASYFYKPVRT
jgi:hypothetical protein